MTVAALELVRIDGRLSIEQQLSIHINDLFDLSYNPKSAPVAVEQVQSTGDAEPAPDKHIPKQQQGYGGGQIDLTLMDVLQGLRYVMDYRISGGKQPSIDAGLMRKLAEALVAHMGHKERSIVIRQRVTVESDLAFALFSDFIEEVEEFRMAVAELSATDLMHAFKIHRRVTSYAATAEQQRMAIHLLMKMQTLFPQQFSDWRELVKPGYHATVEELMNRTEPPALRRLADSGINEKQLQPLKPSSQQLFPPPALYFDRSVERLLDMFQTDPVRGLPTDRIPVLRQHYGSNILPEPPKPSIVRMLWTQMTDFMVLILFAAAILSSALGDFKSGLVLLIVVLINVAIGFTQEFKANKALEALMSLGVPKATVIRDNIQSIVDSQELVPGDLVVLDEGDAVPADLRLVEVAQLEVVESVLTGESVAVAKSTDAIRARTRKLPLGDCRGNAFMSTVVARGRAKGLVVRTGEKTEIGKISSAISSTPDAKTPVQIQLQRLGFYLVAVSVLLCGLIILIGLLREAEAMEMVKVGVALAVSVIPEGLVAVVTVTMAIGVRRMAVRQAIVRKLPSVETLGSVSVICSDKTGTLTEGKMRAVEFWGTSGVYNASGGGPSLVDGKFTIIRRQQADSSTAVPVDGPSASLDFRLAMACCSLCNNSNINRTAEGELEAIGDPTEVALLVAAKKAGLDRTQWQSSDGASRLGEFAFDSSRKLMSIVCTTAASQSSTEGSSKTSSGSTFLGQPFILAKGAPEALLARCTDYLPAGASSLLDDRKPIDEEALTLISSRDQRMASSGLRVLGLAYRLLQNDDQAKSIVQSEDAAQSECQLTFIGLIGLIDPPREGVKESVAKCKSAGIRVIMITGDHVATAVAIATELGIIEPNNSKLNRALKGVELDLLSDDILHSLNPFPTVFARVSPDNKLRIVKALQKQGHYVAMTGDGVNDAPAIKAANVGVAMGIGGTEITKQAADIVLANDNFATIVAAVEEGRRVFDNIKKFVVYLLSCNFAEILVMLLSIAIGCQPPFTSIMILLANIVADIPPSMSLGVEPPEVDVMERFPRDPKHGVITRLSGSVIGMQSFMMGGISLAAYLWTLSADGVLVLGKREIIEIDGRHAQTLTFMLLTTMQLFQGFLSRSVENSVFVTGFLTNRYMAVSFVGCMAAMLFVIFVPPVASFFTCVPLTDYADWLKVFGAVIVQLICSEFMKFWLRRRLRKQRLLKQNRPPNSMEESGVERRRARRNKFLHWLPGSNKIFICP